LAYSAGHSIPFIYGHCIVAEKCVDYLLVIAICLHKKDLRCIMKVGIISVGNSKGIRIPKVILEQCHFNKEAELEVQGNALLIKPVKKVREGWDKAFQLMHERKEDSLVINDSLDIEMENRQQKRSSERCW